MAQVLPGEREGDDVPLATRGRRRRAQFGECAEGAHLPGMTSGARDRSPGRVTSLDVAERAGVSRSAVSRVFTPGASVSHKTAEKVRRAASELGYRPNALARSLLTGRSRMIGLVIGHLDNHFYPFVLESLSRALQAEGYHVLVFMTSEAPETLDQVIREILDYQVDGLILAAVETTSDIVRRCRETGVPVVLFNRRQARPGEYAIVSDNRAGGRLVADHLAAGARRRIAHIAGTESASTQIDREAGFRDGLRAAGLTLHARIAADFRPDRAAAAARAMFEGANRPDAVFVANDTMAFAVMDVLRTELGLDVPGDVAVAGFDGVGAAAWPAYDLTSVRQDGSRMVEIAVALLLARIEGRWMRRPDPVPVDLVVRGSTGRVR